jgi:hypothetical protein
MIGKGSDAEPLIQWPIYREHGPYACPAIANNKEDAQLIAAAPDLLEACKEALATGENDMQHILDNGRLRDVLRAAIAKAEEADAS